MVAVVRERERLARELHDSVTQLLYSLMLFAEMARRQVHVGHREASESTLQRLSETAQQAVKEMRLMIFELRPDQLEREGLVSALQRRLHAVEEHAGIQVHFSLEGMSEFSIHTWLPEKIQMELYQIAMEALNNVLKYAMASSVNIRLQVSQTHVEMEVEDDGKGFDQEEVRKRGGVGLENIRARALNLGGTSTIDSVPGQGTRVVVTVPVERDEMGLIDEQQSKLLFIS
jgi:signal transduction histidine kinase